MAQDKLCVTKVTVQYVARGKVFEVDLKPMEVGSIFFSEDDVQAAQEKQDERANAGAKGVRPVREHLFEPDQPLQPELVNICGATSRQTGEAESPGGPSLWWHAGCQWFHPKN